MSQLRDRELFVMRTIHVRTDLSANLECVCLFPYLRLVSQIFNVPWRRVA